MNSVTINELVDKANRYFCGMVGVKGTGEVHTSIIFNQAKEDDNKITFCQVNQEDVKVALNKKDIVSIEDKSTDNTNFFAITLKSGLEVNVFLFHEKNGDAKACRALYGSYDDFLKELDLYDLEEMIEKTHKAFVSVSDSSSNMKHTYTNVRLEEMYIDDESRKLVFFNGTEEEPMDKLTFTLYDDAINDIWLMQNSEDWDGVKIRLYEQPFTEVRISFIYR